MNYAQMIEVFEGETTSEEDYFTGIQTAINDGAPWKFQGSVGRAMMEAITCGRCLLGRESSSDYYGNYIPNRDQVQDGTKGSYDYIADRYGVEWADYIAGI